MSPPSTPGGDVASTIVDLIVPILTTPQVQLALRMGAWTLLVCWGLAIIWVIHDASRRSPHPLVVALAASVLVLATPLGLVPVLLAWLLVRPQRTVMESRDERLSIAALGASLRKPVCVGCGAGSDPRWRRCPYCRLWLQAPCPRCERPVELGASICPWCVAELPAGALLPRVDVPSALPVDERRPRRPTARPVERAGHPVEPAGRATTSSRRARPAMRVAGAPRS